MSKKKKRILPYLLLLPAFVTFCAFIYYPFAKTLINTFAYTTETGEFLSWAGLFWWKRILTDDFFYMVLKNTLIYASINFIGVLIVSMFFAMLCVKDTKGSRVYQILYSLPMAAATAATAAIFLFVFRQEGLLNGIIGGNTAWLRNTDTAMITVGLIAVWGHIPAKFLYLMVGFKNVSVDLIEAAMIDGAGWWTRFRKIMLPMASPQIFYIVFTTIIGSFKSFSMIKLLTNGGPSGATTNFMHVIYSNKENVEVAAVYSMILFVVIFVATRIQFLFEKKLVHYQ